MKDYVFKFYQFLIPLLLGFPLYAQQGSEELLTELSHASSLQDSLPVLQNLAWYYRRIKPDSALLWAKTYQQTAEQSKTTIHVLGAYDCLGTFYKDKRSLDSSMMYYQWGHQLAQNQKDDSHIAKFARNLGHTERKRRNYEQAIKYYHASLSLYQTIKDSSNIGAVMMNLGNAFKNASQYDSAQYYYSKGLQHREFVVLKKELGGDYLNYASFLVTRHQYKEAIKYYQYSYESYQLAQNRYGMLNVSLGLAIAHNGMENYDLALQYYDSCLRYQDVMSAPLMASIYNAKGVCYENQKQWPLALSHYKNYLDIAHQLKDSLGIATALSNSGNAHLQMKNYQAAKALLLQSQKFTKNRNIKRKNFLFLSKTFEELHDMKTSLSYLKQHNSLKDSLYGENKTREIANMQEKYESEKKEREKKILEQELLLGDAELKQTTTYLYAASIIALLLLLITGLIIRYARLKQKRDQERFEQAEKAHNSQVDEMINAQEIRVLDAMMETKEVERKRIARDLHHNIGGMLSAIRLHFSALSEKLTQPTESYETANTLLEDVVHGVRQISHELDAGNVSRFGLPAALEDLTAKINAADKMTMVFFCHGMDKRLDSKLEITLYRIVQELVSNTLKHAKASKLTLQLTRHEDGITIIAEDGGQGFDAKTVMSQNKGLGLKDTELTVEKLSGQVHIDSKKGQGTSIIIDLPMQELENPLGDLLEE